MWPKRKPEPPKPEAMKLMYTCQKCSHLISGTTVCRIKVVEIRCDDSEVRAYDHEQYYGRSCHPGYDVKLIVANTIRYFIKDYRQSETNAAYQQHPYFYPSGYYYLRECDENGITGENPNKENPN